MVQNDVQNSSRRSDGNAFFYVRFNEQNEGYDEGSPSFRDENGVIPWLKLGKMMGNQCYQILVKPKRLQLDLEPLGLVLAGLVGFLG